jgi:arylsulfatase A-like enzyme
MIGLPALLLAALVPTAAPPPATPARPPNVVIFLADDLGARDLGAYGSTFYRTPNLDRMAQGGMRFTSAYAACPVCSPTRAALATGRWPQRTGITDYIGAAQPGAWPRPTRMLPAPYREQLALEETTLAEALRAAGYATMHAGKWHLGGPGFSPEDQGFDLNRGGLDRGGPYGGKKYFSPYGNPKLTDGPDGEHLADRLAAECGRFIEANRDRPFFVSFWLYDVHTPLMGKPDLVRQYEARAKAVGPEAWGQEGGRKVRLTQNHAVYGAMVETMDGAVGAVLAKLDALGLADDTLVLFTSDNGGLSTSEGWPTSNTPLRGGKGWLYEGGVRVPLIARWPGRIATGTTSDRVVVTPDLFGTVVAACGLGPVPSAPDGVSFLPTLRGEPQPPRGPVFWHYPHYGNQGGFPGGAVRDGTWKLVERYETGGTELYDLAGDPSEAIDLATREPDRAAALRAKLAAWRQDVGAVMPTPNPRAAATSRVTPPR